ncbi:hypothetical protein DI291_06205 [Bacillus paralicheniformis]|nr:hypothetical protein DI291_06205 [Bacillus paralicheniformis]
MIGECGGKQAAGRKEYDVAIVVSEQNSIKKDVFARKARDSGLFLLFQFDRIDSFLELRFFGGCFQLADR